MTMRMLIDARHREETRVAVVKGNRIEEFDFESAEHKQLKGYKIQDVIHRRQVLLVQVVKEERGNKGAALTTYLSLAGRYCVLMPNTTHGGGISRKISNAADRKRLKTIMAELDLPKTMGCIVRTAGLQRTKTEIRRDFDYLARVWDTIRETTLKSSAPTLIHNDSDLIKRAIRDIYNKDIDEVIVEGEEGYRAAREYMKLLMPSHAKRVQPYSDVVPLFQRHHVEDQLNAMYQPVVQLKSGGYLVINPTEALVSIDINSGRSTREHGIEATAVGTNLEAAQEIARQLRLRDMHPGRPDQFVRAHGNEPPASAHRRARGLDAPMPALRRHGIGPHRILRRAFGAALARGGSRKGQWQPPLAPREPGSDDLRPQQEACRAGGDRGTLWRFDRHLPRW